MPGNLVIIRISPLISTRKLENSGIGTFDHIEAGNMELDHIEGLSSHLDQYLGMLRVIYSIDRIED